MLCYSSSLDDRYNKIQTFIYSLPPATRHLIKNCDLVLDEKQLDIYIQDKKLSMRVKKHGESIKNRARKHLGAVVSIHDINGVLTLH